MTATNRLGMVLQDRDRKLLEEIGAMRVIDRDLAKVVGEFHSTTRANARLLKLTRAGLLRRFFLGPKAFYWLSVAGAELAGVPQRGPRRRQDTAIAADFFVEHQLAVNRIRCELKYGGVSVPPATLTRWEAFYDPISPGLQLIPDGYAEIATSEGTLAVFIEVDLGSENLGRWKEKVENYVQLGRSGEFENRFGQSRFRVAVLADTERRIQSIRKAASAIAEKGFWFTTFEAIHREGFFASIWLRLKDETRQPFFRKKL